MVIELTVEQEQRLRRLAADENRSLEEVVHDAIDVWLQRVSDLTQAIQEGEDSAEREGWLTNEEVFARLRERLPKPA
jgi:predicted transcriptional regulator